MLFGKNFETDLGMYFLVKLDLCFVGSEFLDMFVINMDLFAVDVEIELIFQCLCDLDGINRSEDFSGFSSFCTDLHGDVLQCL